MSSSRRGPVAAWLVVVLVATAPACTGGDDGAEDGAPRTAPVVGQGLPPEVDHPVARAIGRLQSAFLAGDYERVCAGLTAAAARQAGEAGHGTPLLCKRDVRALFGLVLDLGGWRHEGKPRVIGVEARGDDAVATVALDRRWQARVPLTRKDGRWRLAGMFGEPPGADRRAARKIAQAPFPATSGSRVRVADAQGDPCPELSEDRYPYVGGGCRLHLSGRAGPLTILTPFGDFRFQRCSILYRVRVDASGRTWTEDFDAQTAPGSVACGDVIACYDDAVEELAPWRGRIHRAGDGSYVHEMDMCLRTCIGNFIGKLRVRLTNDDGTWHGRPVDGGGDTGIRLEHELRVRTRATIDA